MSRRLQKKIWRDRANNQFPNDFKHYVSKSYFFDRSATIKGKRFEMFSELLIEPTSIEGSHWLIIQIGTRRALWLDLKQFEDAFNHIVDEYMTTNGVTSA